MIYTIGHEESYRAAAEESEDGVVWKWGKHDDYPGGYAFETADDARRRIDEAGYEGFAVFGLMADWEEDTEPSDEGWWRHLLYDSIIIFPEALS